jgi:signal transduction histidine kinase
MGALMRALDWTATALGPPETWSPSLQMMTRLLLKNSFPILLWWGPDFIQLYNDAYIPVLGNKHPHAALGKPFRECWAEVFPVLYPLAAAPYNGGPSTWIEDIPLELERFGFREEAHFTISYSPVPDPVAPRGMGGVVAIVHEISAKIIGDRRIAALRDLGARSAGTRTAEEACADAAKILESYPKDIPFALIYLLDEKGEIAYLAGQTGTENCHAICPPVIDLRQDSATWPLARCLAQEDTVLVEDLKSAFASLPAGPWSDPPEQAAVVPIGSTLLHHLAGFFVVGLSSRLRFDDAYRVFLDLASDQIGIAIANARAYEAERRRSEALAEIDRAKTTFFSNISHELRTPLTLILGPLDDMLAGLGDLSPANRGRVELAHRNSIRLLKLVNTLLDFSRIEAGRIDASFVPVDLPAITVDLVSAFRSIVERAGLKLTVDCPPLPEPVFIDRDMWEKIVFNLLSNAFKFTFEGEIHVSVRLVDAGVEVTVSDTGTGIPAEELPELFKRFHRVRGARGRSFEGSGIGLALVQELVRLHGGAVRIESEVDRGSRFIVSLPLGSAHLPTDRVGASHALTSTALAAEAYVHEAELWLANELTMPVAGSRSGVHTGQPHPSTEKDLVLVADDNADMRRYITHLLETHYRVHAVSDGAQAIDALEKLAPSLVVADVMMPEMDGFAVLRAVRSHPDFSSIPVILVSARAGEESRVEGLQAGADDYMAKPFSARDLLARVESHLALARLRRQAESETRQSEMRFRALVAATSDVIYQMNPDWTVMRHLVGRHFIADTESPDQSWLARYIFPDDQPMVLAAIHQAIRTRSTFELEHRVLRADGTVGWTFSRAIPLLDANGDILEWFGAATDITARKRAEEALLRSERLASLGRMAATISHEINNPLEALTNLLFLARNADHLPDFARLRLDEADAELRRVAHITRQALGFYRESTAPAPVDVAALVDSAIDLMRSKTRVRKARLEREWRLRPKITAVAGELRQVFSNLLANSLDAIEDEGVIRVRISRCTTRAGQDAVRVTIADDGKGIDPDHRPHIFEPLFTTKGAVGTGLGLWVTRQIVEKHHGAIQVRSAISGPYRGSTFSLILPS